MKKWFLWTSLPVALILPAGLFVACSVPKQETVEHNTGLLENNQQLTPQTLFLSQNVFSLSFEVNQSSNLLTGTGWLFDVELYPNKTYDNVQLRDIKALYIATNIHVINLVALRNDARLKISQAKNLKLINQNNKGLNPDLFANPLIDGIEAFIKTNKSNHKDQKASFSILPVGLANNSETRTKAVDMAIIRVVPSDFQKQHLPWLVNFNFNTLPSFSSFNDVSNTDFYSAGYAIIKDNKTRRPYYKQYKGNDPKLIAPFKPFYLSSDQKAINYREDNPVYYDENVFRHQKNITNDLVKQIKKYEYDAYDYSKQDFNLGSGASGSPVIDTNNNFIGIYWGGFRIVEKTNNSQFYGNFSPIIYLKEQIKQDLLANYLKATLNYNTYLDHVFATKYLVANLNQNNQQEFNNVVESINQQTTINKQEQIKLIFNFIKGVQTQFNHFNTYNQFNVNDINQIKLIKNPNKDVKLLVQISFKDQSKKNNYFYFI
ncbi:DUF31 family putative serine protease [Ureaplasma diversum]|uniref:DUF31 domain-containing protein n=1 Tax=Ureaplasma diversum NCTC 246 TaxID=1188241 RepID=A0A084EXP6_9BACT|nr:hypothetical protein [Ureaplasma diversum]KEZ22738.1 Hypothetical protein, predicted lipoprotein, putative peptidase [Ureaplasma diversum NCTC 246]